MLEATIIFGGYPLVENQDTIYYDINMSDLNYALTLAMHSSWWEWLDGSWLFFWSWPPLWMREARDGALVFHLYFPPPKLRFYSPLIKEEFILPTTYPKILTYIPRSEKSSTVQNMKYISFIYIY